MPPARRRGAVSEAERALWRDWAERAGVSPLPGRALPPRPAPPAPDPVPVLVAVPDPARPAPRRAAPAPIEVGRPAGLDERRWRDLRRGRLRPERTLDLHGRRAEEAHAAVQAFLREAQAEGLRCVAVVTGKGRGGDGVLRRELPHWLNGPGLRPLLLAAAHPDPGNAGAVHLLLRRRR